MFPEYPLYINFGQVCGGEYSSMGLINEPKAICSSENTAQTLSVKERSKPQSLNLGLFSGLDD